jgi:hypothetical protein
MGYMMKETKSCTKFCVKNPVDRDYFNYFGDPDTAENLREIDYGM